MRVGTDSWAVCNGLAVWSGAQVTGRIRDEEFRDGGT